MIPLPEGLVGRPTFPSELPVPWFCAREGEGFDFRKLRPHAVRQAVDMGLCFTCGLPLDPMRQFFATGPGGLVHRQSPWPPSCEPCMRYAVRACPFLANPMRQRRREYEQRDDKSSNRARLLYNPGLVVRWEMRRLDWHEADREKSYHPSKMIFDKPRDVAFYWAGDRASKAVVCRAYLRTIRLLWALDKEPENPMPLGAKLDRRIERGHRTIDRYCRTDLTPSVELVLTAEEDGQGEGEGEPATAGDAV